MPVTLFDQERAIMATIRSNFIEVLHENEELRKLIIKLQEENDRLKSDTSQEVSES